MKKTRHALCFLLALSLFLCAGVSVKAAETRASLYLTAYSAYIYSEGNGKISVWFEVEPTRTMEEVGVLTIRLQEQAPNSSTWTTVKTYSYVDYPDLLGSNTNYHWGHVDYEGIVGYSYRAYVTVWAGENGDGDSRIILAT